MSKEDPTPQIGGFEQAYQDEATEEQRNDKKEPLQERIFDEEGA